MVSRYARGRYARAMDDRSGFEVAYSDLIKDTNGSYMVRSELDGPHPLDRLRRRLRGVSAEALKHPRPDRDDDSANSPVANWPWPEVDNG